MQGRSSTITPRGLQVSETSLHIVSGRGRRSRLRIPAGEISGDISGQVRNGENERGVRRYFSNVILPSPYPT